jgi:hypothetical protein
MCDRKAQEEEEIYQGKGLNRRREEDTRREGKQPRSKQGR